MANFLNIIYILETIKSLMNFTRQNERQTLMAK